MEVIEVAIGGGDDWMDVYLSNDGFDHFPPDRPGNVGTCRICGVPDVAIKIGNDWKRFHSVGKPNTESNND